jgi:hypothetical protein
MGVTVESDDKLDRTVTGAASPARSRDFGFPIRLFFVEAADSFPPLGYGGPRLVRARGICHETAGRNRDLAGVRGLAFCHSETTGLFGRGREIRWNLGADIRRLYKQGEQQQSADAETPAGATHVTDGTTVSLLAATGATA